MRMMQKNTRPLSRIMSLSLLILKDKIEQRRNFNHQSAVFLDRDGTINIEQGYIINPLNLEIYPSAGEAIFTLNTLGFLVIIVTNQAAIGKGLLTLTQFEEVNQALWDSLRQSKAYYDALYYCPHDPEIKGGCECRKPQEGLILQAAMDFNINLSSSYLVGDKLSDIEVGQKCGCTSILVLTGYGPEHAIEKTNKSITPSFIAETLTQAVCWIKSSRNSDHSPSSALMPP